MSRNTSNPAVEFGISIAVAMVGFTLLGVWLDKKYQTNGWLIIAGVFLAFAYIGYELWKMNKQSYRDQDKEEDDK